MRRRTTLAAVAGLALVGACGAFAVRQRWVEVLLLLAPDRRVENFRRMGEIFPSRSVPRAGPVFEFARAERPLDVTYPFAGERRHLDAFLERTTTTGLLVIQDDAIVLEQYRLGASDESLLTSFSVAKSVVSALVGFALADGSIRSLDDPVTAYVPELAGSGYDGVPIRHVLEMSSGVRFDENYANPLSDVNLMFAGSFLFGSSIDAVARGLPSQHRSGEAYEYKSVDTQVLAAVVRAATGRTLSADLSLRIWGPLGMERDARWVVDSDRPDAVEYAFCCLNATLRDWARFARLYLRQGNWQGVQLLPADWIHASVTPSRPELMLQGLYSPAWDVGYAYQWWVPAGDEGEFTAIGVWGQYLYVNPAERLVIVKTSADPGFDDRDLETIAAFRGIVDALRTAR